MRKEIVFATVAGIILGVIVAFGVWRFNSVLKDNNTPAEIATSSENNADNLENNNSAEVEIALTKYENDDVVTGSPITISGITKANSFVVISAEDEDYTAESDGNGEFNINVDLAGGINNLLIKAFDDQGKSKEMDLRLVYSSEFAKDLTQE